MVSRRINSILCIGLTGTLIFGTSLFTDMYRVFRGDRSIWWTHEAMMLPVEQTRDNFEVYIDGKLLQKHLSDRTLYAVDKKGLQYPVVSKDIAVRLNNWDRVRASILTYATMSSFAAGASIALLLMGLVRFFHREEEPRGQ